MLLFLDIEATGLIEDSFPIEIAWVLEDGSGAESHYIKPAPHWTTWNADSEQIHNITRDMLEEKGEPVEEVAARVVEVFSGHDIYASSPNWDQKWLSDLLEAGGYPRDLLSMQDTEVAQAEAIAETLGIDMETAPRDPGEELPRDVETIMVLMDLELRADHTHTALDDAEEERWRWLRVQEMAREQLRKQKEYGW